MSLLPSIRVASLRSARLSSFGVKTPSNHQHQARQAVVLLHQPAAGIAGKAKYEEWPKPPPWDYMNKGYTGWHSWYEGTLKRFDENTKVVLIEGLPGIGKQELAKALAEEFGMKLYPPATMDLFYVNPYGFDLRTLDDKVPASVRSYDEQTFLKKPKDKRLISMESNLLQYTYSRYWDALVHLFNTGQGVILTRNPFSHQAFVEGLYKAGYLNWDEYRRVYCKLKESSINELRKPHLIIYLDAPVSVLHDRLKARGKGEDKVITKEFLSTMENWYKTKYLKEMEVNTEVVVYDWSEPADFEVVVEDIERIDFERYDVEPRHPKFKDWHFDEDIVASEVRWKFTQQKARHMQILARVPCWDVPSLHFEQDDLKALYTVYRNAPGNFFFYPYNPKMGDKVWWKSNPKGYEPIEKTSWSNWVP